MRATRLRSASLRHEWCLAFTVHVFGHIGRGTFIFRHLIKDDGFIIVAVTRFQSPVFDVRLHLNWISVCALQPLDRSRRKKRKESKVDEFQPSVLKGVGLPCTSFVGHSLPILGNTLLAQVKTSEGTGDRHRARQRTLNHATRSNCLARNKRG